MESLSASRPSDTGLMLVLMNSGGVLCASEEAVVMSRQENGKLESGKLELRRRLRCDAASDQVVQHLIDEALLLEGVHDFSPAFTHTAGSTSGPTLRRFVLGIRADLGVGAVRRPRVPVVRA